MLVASVVHCIAVLIFQVLEVQTLSPIPACPASCTCEETLLVNCSSLDLPKAPSYIPATATALDLSHNALHSLAPLGSGHMHLRGLRHLRVGNNSLEILSMCSGIRGVVHTRTLTGRVLRCVSWAPDLQSLSAERNQLKFLPRGLGNIKSLKVLQLSYNRISEIGPADLTGCTHLNELHLQHNLINSIHPESFKDVQKLKVLDLSHNLLITIPVPAYLSLRNLNVSVDISRNRWRCDCSLRTTRRWLRHDSEQSNPTWKVVCFSPFYHAGKNLVDLEESELNCPRPVYSTPGEVTVDEGMELILSCGTANKDFLHTRWWTPHGQISDSQTLLYITNITEHDAGRYVCVSGRRGEHVSVFSVHVRKRAHDKRLRREAQTGLVEFNAEDGRYIQRNVPAVRTVQQSQFALAVCLSVFITFVVAFILGVVLRPFMEKCYKQTRNKTKSTPNSNSQTSTAQRPYVNEGYSDPDDKEQEVHEGPRVTFGGVTEIHEQGRVPFYVTVEGDTDAAELYENTGRALVKHTEVHKEVPLGEENEEMPSTISTESLNDGNSKEMQFEYIPEPEAAAEFEEWSVSPVSVLAGIGRQESQMSYEAKESIEQSLDSPTGGTYDKADELSIADQGVKIPGFTTDPFPLKMFESKEESVDELDPDLWTDSGESFSFTEGSPRSSSRVSYVAHPLNRKEMSVDEPFDRASSCNSSESGGGPTEYTVTIEDHKDSETCYLENNDLNYAERRFSDSGEDIVAEDQKKGTGARLRQDTITLDPTDMHITYTRGDSYDDELFAGYKEDFPSSKISAGYEDEPTQYNVHPVYRTSLKTTSLTVEDRTHTGSLSENNSGSSFDDDIFGVIDQIMNPIPQVKQYLHFSQGQSCPPIQSRPHSTEEEIIPNKAVENESKKFSSEDNFFVQIDASLDDLPKVKEYIQFLPSELSYNSKPAAPRNQAARPIVESKTESPSDTIDISYKGQTISLAAMPKIQRHVYIGQSAPQAVDDHTVHSQTNHPIIRPVVVTKISVDDYTPTVQGAYLLGQIPISFDEVPKVKQYVQFSPSKSQLLDDSTPSESSHQLARPVEVAKTDVPSDTITIFYKGQNTSLQAMPKVQRHISFKQSEPHSVNKHTPPIQGGSLFERLVISFDDVPKVKQYVGFSSAESPLSTDSVHTESATPGIGLKSDPLSDPISIFYKGQTVSLTAMPTVQRYVQFGQSEPLTVHKHTPDTRAHSFFEEIPISFEEVAKLRRHIVFSQSEFKDHLSLPYRPLKHPLTDEQITHKIKTPLVTSKAQNAGDQFIDPNLIPSQTNFFELTDASVENVPKVNRSLQFTKIEAKPSNQSTPSLSGQIHTSFDKVPKVKRYLQFIKSDPQSSAFPSASRGTDTVTPAFVTKMQTTRSEDKRSPTVKGDYFFSLPVPSFNELPKVRTYIQFTRTEPRLQPPLLPSVSDTTDKTKDASSELPVKDLASEDYIQQSAGKHNILGPIDESFEIPKLQRYIQFSRKSTQPAVVLKQTASVLTNPELKKPRSSLVDSKLNDEYTFFKKMEVSELPKVKRFIQFTHQHSTSKSPNNDGVLADVAKEVKFRGSDSSGVEIEPSVTEENFFGLGSNLNLLPRVKRYIHFAQSEPQPSETQSQNQTERITKKEWKTENLPVGTDTKLSTKDTTMFNGVFESFDNIPKVKKSLLFTQSKYQNLNLQQNFRPHSAPRPESVGRSLLSEYNPLPEKRDFLGHLGASLDDVPKVKKYVQFSQSEASTPSQSFFNIKDQSPSPFYKTETVTPVLATKPESGRADFSFGKPHTSEASFGKVPKVNRYIQFTQSEVSAHSPLAAVTTEGVTPAKKMQTTRSEHTGSPTIMRDDLFSQTVSSFHELPKVEQYIDFTQTEPGVQPSMRQSFSNQTDKTLHASSELQRNVSSSKDYIQPAVGEHNILGPIGESFEIPKLKRYIQISQSQSQSPTEKLATKAPLLTQSQHKKAISGNDANTEFGSFDLPFNQAAKINRNVQIDRSEPYLSTEEVFNLSPKKYDFLGQTDGVPTLIRYRQHRRSEPHTSRLSPYIPSQKWKTMDVESREAGMFKTNVTLDSVKDLSQKQDASPAGKVAIGTNRLHQELLDPEVYGQAAVDKLLNLSSNISTGDKKYANTHSSSSRTAFSTTEPERLKSMSRLASFNESAALQRKLVLDSALQDVTQSVTDTLADSSGKDDAREYLRDSSLARQRQERRRLMFQEKRRAMDGFSLSSESFESQKSDHKESMEDDPLC